MEKGKRPMSPGYEKRLQRQQQRRQQPELLLGGMRSNLNNQRPALPPKSKPPQTLEIKRDHAYYLQRKFSTRRARNGKDWVPTEQEVEDEGRRYPEVDKLLEDRLRPLGVAFSDDRYNRYMAGIEQECDALQAKLDARDEADYWAIWGDVDAEDDDDETEEYGSDYIVDITKD